MKQILLAKKSKRLLAGLIDFGIITLLTLITFFGFVYPHVFDAEQFNLNNERIVELYRDTGLFVVDDDGNYAGKCSFNNIEKIDDLYNCDITFNNKKYLDISLTESLYEYYTQKYANYDGQNNLTDAIYKQEILKLGSEESNIQNYDEINHTITMIDDSKNDITITYFINIYESTCKNLISNSKIDTLTKENQSLMLNSLSLIIPVLIIYSFIFDLLIPLFMPYSETIGKKIMHLGLVSKDGYHLKKYYLIPRFLVYTFIEYILGFATFGGVFLISYTMFLFCKKRRCLHDFVANSVVIDIDNSIFFANKKEEAFYINRQRNRGIDL